MKSCIFTAVILSVIMAWVHSKDACTSRDNMVDCLLSSLDDNCCWVEGQLLGFTVTMCSEPFMGSDTSNWCDSV